MEVEWSVAAGEDDPVIVVPWSDDAGVCVYVDLRACPDRIEQIAEACAWPELRTVLLLLNAPASGVWTAKCDAWELTEDEKALDFGPVAYGVGCYIDVIREQEALFASFEGQLTALQRVAAATLALASQDARADFVLRPAQNGPAAGFATTVYVYGYGEQLQEARERWAQALGNVVRAILYETVE